MLDLAALRAEFPVLERVSYLNAGSNGPVPRRAVAAAAEELRREEADGRGGGAYFDHWLSLLEDLRGRIAPLLGCDADELALTGSTTGGVNTVVAALDLGPGDEVLTSDEEHPGLLAPLAAGGARRGFDVRAVPFSELAGQVRSSTRLIACSHVSWVSGAEADTAALCAAGPPLLLDGAQALGAVPVDVRNLGCAFYACSGQKWLCGPKGAGYLYVRHDRVPELLPPWPGYGALAEAEDPFDLEFHDSARRFDSAVLGADDAAWALAALATLEDAGVEAVLERGPSSAGRLASELEERGLSVASRGRSTLVSWDAQDAEAEVERLAGESIVVRALPGRGLVRASIGAWTNDEELERLIGLVA